MNNLLKKFLITLSAIVFLLTLLVLHFTFLEFIPEERNYPAFEYSATFLLGNTKEFFKAYYENIKFSLDGTMGDPSAVDTTSFTFETEEIPLPKTARGTTEDDLNHISSVVTAIHEDVSALEIAVEDILTSTFRASEYVTVSCDSTYIYTDPNFRFVRQSNSFFSEVEVGDIFEASCTNEECSNLTGGCILIKRDE